MVRLFFQYCFVVVTALALASCGQSGEPERGPVVLAAASMQGALEEVADSWVAQGNTPPVLSFSATPAIARQVEQGAPADIVITADAEWMDWLEERALIAPESRRDIVANTLVFVRRDRDIIPPGWFAEYGTVPRSIAIAEPSTVPAGRYAKQALMEAGLWEEVSAIAVPTENVRAALALAQRGEVDMAIVYASDAKSAPDLIAVPLDLPEGVTIRYPAAMLTASSHPESAGLTAFLAGETAQAIFADYGFSPLP